MQENKSHRMCVVFLRFDVIVFFSYILLDVLVCFMYCVYVWAVYEKFECKQEIIRR